ncbi:hypothetical protein [Streptantibioticus ferralitis]|uniref:Secreted protein n=1 Tax=Streptantibioticus ferralitis TaxID=236510 RepID=A0ABT5Z4X9_9ACTN|nr:hypothetical protein [Streptantibioticus ferralitis]MDF2258631.1 hypothetical protein [Streptantibioticus ferralitis]
MRIASSRRGARAAAVAALAFAATVAGAGPVCARPGTGHPRIDVRIDPSGIRAPRNRPCGNTTFQVHTSDRRGRQLQLFRPKRGVRWRRVLEDLVNAVSRDPRTAATGIHAVRADAEALGGAFVTSRVPTEFTEAITAGWVYLLDFTDFRQHPSADAEVETLHLHGPCRYEPIRRPPTGRVLTVDTQTGPRFRPQDVDYAHGTLLVHDISTEIHEMRIQPVRSGTTDADLTRYFDALAHGRPAERSPFTGEPTGLGAISPGRTVMVHPHHLRRGTYALLCFVPDEGTGAPHTFLGMHQIVRLHG